MTDRFANLAAACGGAINPETLTRFQIAMREYEVFMALGREMFRPVDSENMATEMEDKLKRRSKQENE